MTTVAPAPITDQYRSESEKEAQRFADVVRYNIRRYMRLTGVLQKDIAKATGISRPAVTLMLNGGSELRLERVYLIAKELGVTFDDLFDDTYYKQDEDFLNKMSQEMKKAPTGNRSRLSEGAPAGIRTLDTLIKSQLL